MQNLFALEKAKNDYLANEREKKKKTFEIVNHKANTIFTVILMPALEWKQDRKMSNTSCFFSSFLCVFVCLWMFSD